jgi:lipopolysaccharide biosynthesis glycosyltransferase
LARPTVAAAARIEAGEVAMRLLRPHVRPADVVYVSDDNYIIPLSVSIRSLQESTSNTDLTISVLCDDLSLESKRRILESVPFPDSVQLLDINGEELPNQVGYGVSARISRAALAVFKLVSEFVNPTRWLYLDADTVVRADISGLLGTDLKGNIIGAVYDHCYTLFERGTRRLSVAGALSGRRFNSGVMLVATQQWFEEQVGSHAEEVVRSIGVMDQGALNCICAGRWLELDPGWNVTTQELLLGRVPCSDPQRVRIRHLTAVKPWLAAPSVGDDARLMLDDYYRHFGRTYWGRSTLPDLGNEEVMSQ